MKIKCLISTFLILLVIGTTVFAQDGWLPPLDHIEYSAAHIEALAQIGQGHPSDIEWSNDGNTIVVASSIGVWLYDAQDLQAEPQFIDSGQSELTASALSPDNRRLAIASDHIYIWEIAENHVIQTIDAGENILDLAFSTDGTQVVTSHGFFAENNLVALWDIETGVQVQVFDNVGVFTNLQYSPENTYVAGIMLGDCCFRVSVWDTANGQQVFSGDIQVGADEDDVIFSPDSTTLAVVDRRGTVILWDIVTQRQRAVLPITDQSDDDFYPLDAAFSADGKQFMTISRMGILRIWNVESGELIETSQHPPAYLAAFNPALTRIAGIDTNNQLYVSETDGGNIVAERAFLSINTPRVVFNQDGSRMAFASGANVVLWDMINGEPAAWLRGHEGIITDLAFSSDSSQLASAGSDGTVRFWNVVSGSLDEVFVTLDTRIKRIIFHEDNELLIATERAIQVYDLTTHEPLPMFHDPTTDTNSLSLDYGVSDILYNGRQIIVANGTVIEVWSEDESSGLNQVTPYGHFISTIRTLAYDSEFLLSSHDDTVLAWDARTFQFAGVVITHNSWIYDVVISPNYVFYASVGCAQTNINHWDGSPICSGAEMRLTAFDPYSVSPAIVPQGHKDAIRGVIFNPAATLLVTNSDDGTIILWGIPADTDS